MRKIVLTAAGAVLIALSISTAASASERHRRHAPPQPVGVTDPRDAFGYYPGWGRDRVPSYGVYPGLIYGGAISAPAGR